MIMISTTKLLKDQNVLLLYKKSEVFSDFSTAMEDIVSSFIVSTCRMFPTSSTNAFESMYLQNNQELKSYPLASGCCAEFFIQPLQPCFGDIDCLQIHKDALVFTSEWPVLPYDLRHIDDSIDCLLMESYVDYPAFVRLRLLGKVKYNWERKEFQFIKSKVCSILDTQELEVSVTVNNDTLCNRVGPSIKTIVHDYWSMDIVKAIWCPQWPKVAERWPSRRRKYGYPTIAIIHEVVQNGCHVVFAKHPECRNDVHQCRLSFSIAENHFTSELDSGSADCL